MISSEFLVFGSPRIEEEEIQEVVSVLRSGWIGTGQRVQRFEEAFRAYKGAAYAAAVNSCTAALHLCLVALDLKPGDEVITTPMTFCATLNAIVHAGATPVLADCDRRTLNIDAREVERKITRRTRAILPVHFAGRPCAMDELMDLARRRGLAVVEDCAHAIETEYKGGKAGTFGDFGCFSFYVTKNITTAEGGMVLARDAARIDRIKVLALHGMSKDAWKRFSDDGYKHYQVVEAGFKYNMTDMQAALGLHQLGRVERWWERRRELWARYNEAFRGLPCILPADPEPGTRHAYHLYTPLIDLERAGKSRDQVLQELFARKIGTGVHYIASHLHPFYSRRLGHKRGDFPNAEFISDRTLSLPLSAKLTDQDAARVIQAFREVLS
ncbi:MAG TPA: DegT/DnrJ/EryC1/StrS family aminotransferase [Elusimicrobiota bacterium]|jgi:dTDP-4-amino-4,6-dideoxygalactose transaminase|nr:DegT/DnrJ/EryC1/StrS family aminotransferase [Elusimicrobiota bacterium]